MPTSDDLHITVPFDLYREIHKAIRVALFDLVAEAGRIDPSDRPTRMAHATRVRETVRFLAMHADHEDEFCEPAIAQVLPELAADRVRPRSRSRPG